MFKLLLLCAICATTLTACEKEKQVSAEVGAIPKQLVDKVTTDINSAATIATEQLKAAEGESAPEDVGR